MRRASWLVLGVMACTATPREKSDPGVQTTQASKPSTPPCPAPATKNGPNGSITVDGQGVEMLFPSAPGASVCLASADPNDTSAFAIEGGVVAKRKMLDALVSWNLQSTPLHYADGHDGTTTRLHLYASGGTQQYDWQTQNGYLATPNDLKNQEVTAYVRPHQVIDAPRATISLKIRGGAHTSNDGDLASCTMMTIGTRDVPETIRFGKELVHPNYDYVKLVPVVDVAVTDGAWIGLKMVSYASSKKQGGVVNRLYVDTTPFDANGVPRNAWRLAAEYVDREGKSTGSYSKLVDWGGWETTIRVDGFHDVDLAKVSAREITPPP